jgi:hypothetical protein
MKLFNEFKQMNEFNQKEHELSMIEMLRELRKSDTFFIRGNDDKVVAWPVIDGSDEYKKILSIIDKRLSEAVRLAGQDPLYHHSESVTTPLFTDYKAERNKGISYLTEEENQMVDQYVQVFETEHDSKIDEGIFGKIVGGLSGFLVGPTIGKIIAKALGIERGILYDMFTSRLVSTALGSAIGKYMTENKIKN